MNDEDPSDSSEVEIISSISNSNGESSDTKGSMEVIAPVTDLPSTVTYLTGPNDSQVYIVGTAHFSEESNQDVIKTLEKVKPHFVCLELCKSRLHVIKCTEEEILEEVQNIGISKLRELVSRSGSFYGIFQFVLLHLSSGLTKQLGLAPGGEFRAAYRKGLEQNCRFILIDRSIQTTLKRAVYSLSVWKQIGLAVKLMLNNDTITKEDVENFKGDILQKLIDEITETYPNLSKIFVDERDQYLSSKIYEAASNIIISKPKSQASPSNSSYSCEDNESEAEKSDGEDGEREGENEDCERNADDDSEPEIIEKDEVCSDEEVTFERTTIVAVVGIGHIAGIKKYWGQKIDCSAICVIPEPSLQTRIILKTIKYSFVSLMLYGSYTLVSYLYPYLPGSSYLAHYSRSIYSSLRSSLP